MDIVIRSFHSLLCVEITVGCWYSILRSNLIINLYSKMSKSFLRKQLSLYFNKIVLIYKYLDISTHNIYAMFLHPLLFCVPLLGECCCVDIYVLRCCTLGIVVKNKYPRAGVNLLGEGNEFGRREWRVNSFLGMSNSAIQFHHYPECREKLEKGPSEGS